MLGKFRALFVDPPGAGGSGSGAGGGKFGLDPTKSGGGGDGGSGSGASLALLADSGKPASELARLEQEAKAERAAALGELRELEAHAGLLYVAAAKAAMARGREVRSSEGFFGAEGVKMRRHVVRSMMRE